MVVKSCCFIKTHNEWKERRVGNEVVSAYTARGDDRFNHQSARRTQTEVEQTTIGAHIKGGEMFSAEWRMDTFLFLFRSKPQNCPQRF